MGSWNETCWLSNLPILSGDSCYLILIAESGGYGSDRTKGLVYNNTIWCPIALPILGEYDDYGSLEGWDEESPALKILRESLKSRTVKYPAGKNQYHDLPVSEEMFDEADWLYQVQQRMSHGMGIQIGRPAKRLGAVLVRADVYDALSEVPIESWENRKLDYSLNIKELNEYRESNAKLKTLKDSTDEDNPERSLENILSLHFAMEASGYKFFDIRWDREVLMPQMMLNDKDIVDSFARFIQVKNHASSLRKLWHPTCGSGSQEESFGLHISFSKIVKKCAKSSMGRYNE